MDTNAMSPRLQAFNGAGKRGTLRLYLGAAPGVGKTYAMLQEAHRLEGHGCDIVGGLTGVHVRETIPDGVLDTADQLELIDMAPEALIRPMVHGTISPPEQAKRTLENFFTVGSLAALRDLALRATAREVEDKLAASVRDEAERATHTGANVMVAVDHQPVSKSLIREGWHMAAALKGAMIVVHVEPQEGRRQPQTVEQERQLRATLQLADELGAKVVHLRGRVADEMIAYARANGISQVVIGHPTRGRWEEFLHGSVTDDILRALPDIDAHIVPAPRSTAAG